MCFSAEVLALITDLQGAAAGTEDDSAVRLLEEEARMLADVEVLRVRRCFADQRVRLAELMAGFAVDVDEEEDRLSAGPPLIHLDDLSPFLDYPPELLAIPECAAVGSNSVGVGEERYERPPVLSPVSPQRLEEIPVVVTAVTPPVAEATDRTHGSGARRVRSPTSSSRRDSNCSPHHSARKRSRGDRPRALSDPRRSSCTRPLSRR